MKTTPDYELLGNAIKRNANNIGNILPHETREKIIEQEQIIATCKQQTRDAIRTSNEIIEQIFNKI